MTMQEKPALIVPRRNFLIRAFGFTAAGTTLPISIITADDAKARMDHHEAELRKVWQDYYGPAHNVRGDSKRGPVGTLSPAHVPDDRRSLRPHYRTSRLFIFVGGGEL